jgi:UDP-N-acetylmuramate dehydrogenase
MTGPLVAQLRRRVTGEVLAEAPLAPHTTLKVGGPAAALVKAETVADVVAVAETCAVQNVPWLILGRGSNLLVADTGWPGVVVTLGRGFRGVEVEGDGDRPGETGDAVLVVAGGAEPMPVLAGRVADLGLGGLEFGVAIPGSLGGAVRMNAGAHGQQMRDVLVSAEVARLAHGGALETIAADDLGMRYRHTDLPPDALVVRATLRLRRAVGSELAAAMAEMRQWRREHQPINVPSCGSVFRNPEGDSAGRLIEAAGMKGHRVGGAQVSEVHANFITVSPGASAADVHAVISDVTKAVERSQGVRLQTEVVLAGFDVPARQSGTS